MESRTDKELLDSYAADGDEPAFAELVSRYHPMVYRTCWRLLGNDHDAEDAAQAAFLVLARKAGSLRQEGRLNGWLHRVARLTALEAVRRRAARERHQAEYALGTDIPVADQSEADMEAVLRQVDAALDGLSVVLREAVVLRYLRGFSEREAAAQAGCAVSAMKWRTSDGIAKLRARLTRRGVTLSGAALAGLLASEASAAVPETLLPSILASVKGLATATAAGTGATSTAVILAKGAMKAMFIAKVKTVSLAVAACLVVAGTGIVAAKHLAGSSTGLVADQTTPAAAAVQPDTSATPSTHRPATPAQPVTEAPQPAAGAETGLELSLTANRIVTEMTADGRNAKPVQLKIGFTNRSGHPIKLDTYMLLHRLLRLRIDGPAGGVVTSLQEIWLTILGPTEREFPVLAPGETFVYHDQPQIPSGHGFGTLRAEDRFRSLHYVFAKPGIYRITAVYEAPAPVVYPGTEEILNRLGAGVWQGRIESAPLAVVVKPAGDALVAPAIAPATPVVVWGKAEKGVQAGVAMVTPQVAVDAPIEFEIHLRNQTDHQVSLANAGALTSAGPPHKGWTITLIGDRKIWQAKWVPVKDLPLEPGLVELAPGETTRLSVAIQTGAWEFVEVGRSGRPRPLPSLPVGHYSVSAAYTQGRPSDAGWWGTLVGGPASLTVGNPPPEPAQVPVNQVVPAPESIEQQKARESQMKQDAGR